MLCHGSGLTTQTLSDMVTEMELVDANGELRVIMKYVFVFLLLLNFRLSMTRNN